MLDNKRNSSNYDLTKGGGQLLLNYEEFKIFLQKNFN